MPERVKGKDEFIEIKGGRVHNLKNVNINIPRNKFIVITGLSGSGKSSLAFDTLYAEGQRRYVESLSSYARQFLGRIDKPDVDYIKGIPPAIAIEQKVNTRNPRSTVGTSTEIYDYIKLFYARIGKTFSPVSNKEVKHHTVSDVVDYISSVEAGTRLLVLTKIVNNKDLPIKERLQNILRQGNTRVEKNGEIMKIEELLKQEEITNPDQFNIVVDRLVADDTPDFRNRAADSVQSAFYEGNGECLIMLK